MFETVFMPTYRISPFLLGRRAHKVSNTHPQISFKTDDITALRNSEERLCRPRGPARFHRPSTQNSLCLPTGLSDLGVVSDADLTRVNRAVENGIENFWWRTEIVTRILRDSGSADGGGGKRKTERLLLRERWGIFCDDTTRALARYHECYIVCS